MKNKTYYMADSEHINQTYGTMEPVCVTLAEIERLAREWDMTTDELLEQFHEASAAELETYGTGEREQTAITRAWKVYGVLGHRQRESFSPSYTWDFTEGDNVRIIKVENSDTTGTNEYTIVRITRNTAEECEDELWGQVTDGIFENSGTGNVVEIEPGEQEE